MSVLQIIRKTKAEVRRQANPAKAKQLKRFFTEPIQTHGLTVPQARTVGDKIYQQYHTQLSLAESVRVAEKLWRRGVMEEVYVGMQILDKFKPDIYQVEMFKIYDYWVDFISNWAHNDLLTTHFIGGVIKENPKLAVSLIAWTKSKNRWRRRAAITSFVLLAKDKIFWPVIKKIVLCLRFDRDPMVAKGLGWTLREAYKGQPGRVFIFLLKYKADFARITLNYAWEKMPTRLKNQLKVR